RRGWDSKPRYGYPYNGFRDRSVSDGNRFSATGGSAILLVISYASECPLLAHSGLFERARLTSAFGGKADVSPATADGDLQSIGSKENGNSRAQLETVVTAGFPRVRREESLKRRGWAGKD